MTCRAATMTFRRRRRWRLSFSSSTALGFLSSFFDAVGVHGKICMSILPHASFFNDDDVLVLGIGILVLGIDILVL